MHWDASTVYFDYEKANLTAAAADAVAEAVSHHPRHEVVTGYCDTAEHHCHDLGLRRAEAVKDELVRRGMPAGAIETRASDDLAVPTPKHVREPKNRRVVIDPR
jgi:outer membrane protein OmpA-like peptidoglycan-associated protein